MSKPKYERTCKFSRFCETNTIQTRREMWLSSYYFTTAGMFGGMGRVSFFEICFKEDQHGS